MRKMNQTQIDRLYHFTREHFVEYYDVQIELVDHLASAIEEKWSQNPNLEFEEALQQEFKKFGVFGFLEVVEERQKAMTKTYWNLILKEASAFLKLPKVLVVIGVICLIFWNLTQFKYGKTMISAIVICEMIFFIYRLIKLNREKKKLVKKERRIYLLEDIILNVGQFGALSFFPGYLLLYFDKIVPVAIGAVIMAIVITFSFVIHYIGLIILPSKKDAILSKTYPELGLNN